MSRMPRIAAVLVALPVALVAVGVFTGIANAGGTGPSPSPTTAGCVSIASAPLSHTWDGQTVTVTLAGEKSLCTPLVMLVAKYSYDNPVVSIWPQHLVGTSAAVMISSPGTYAATAPNGCGQSDAYAKKATAPVPSPTLTGPGKPFEPNFVSDFSNGPITNHADKKESCVTTPSPSPTPTPTVTPTPSPTVTPTPSPSASHVTPAPKPTPSLIPSMVLAHTGGDPRTIELGIEAALLLILAGVGCMLAAKRFFLKRGSH